MDSILGTDRKKIDAIKETIRDKKMTANELSSHLSQVIQTEMKKPLAEMDEAFVKECEDILWQLNSDTDYVSHANESKKEVMDKLSGNQQHKFFSNRISVVVCAALVLVCLVGLIDAAFHFEWLTGSSTKDEQQYVDAIETLISKAPIPMKAVLGNSTISVSDFSGLQVGDIIRLDTKVNQELDVFVGNIKKFTALPGSSGDKYAVRITSVIREEQ